LETFVLVGEATRGKQCR